MSHLRKLFKNKTASEIKEGADKVVKLLQSKDATKKLHMTGGRHDLSILDVAEATLGEDGMSALRHSNDEECFRAIQEAVDPINLTAFSNITGNMVFQGVMEQYKSPELIGDQLVTNEVSREDNTRVPGISPINDDVLIVKEGEEYPDVKFGEDYIDIPKSDKRGAKIGITREMIFFDRTGMVMDMARSVGDRMGTNREKRILRIVLGIDDNFVRKGVARNTYVASADPRINQLASKPLVDWSSFDAAMQLFAGYTDDRTTGEPIQVMPKSVLVTPYNWATVNRILHATQVRTGTNTAATQTYGANPMSEFGVSLKPLMSQWIQWLLVNVGALTATQAKNYWHIGDFQKAFVYRTLFPLQVRTAHHDKDDFERDVVAQFRADERGVCYVKAPWYVAQMYDT